MQSESFFLREHCGHTGRLLIVGVLNPCVQFIPHFSNLGRQRITECRGLGVRSHHLGQDERATARSFDNKMGCYIVAEAMRLLKDKQISCSVYGVATVQEEIGLRGARTSAFGIDPLVGIAADVGHAMDFPGSEKKKHR